METSTVKVNPDGSATFSPDLRRRLNFEMGGELDFGFEGSEWVSVAIRKYTASDLFPPKIQQLLIERAKEIDEKRQCLGSWEDWRHSGKRAESA